MSGPTKHISMRLDSTFKESLEDTLNEEERVAGRKGGVSELFRRLAHLYLRRPLPAASWRKKLDKGNEREDLSLLSMDDIEAELVPLEEKLWVEGGSLDDDEIAKVKYLLRQALCLTHPLMKSVPDMNQHRGANLVGRLQVMDFDFEFSENF